MAIVDKPMDLYSINFPNGKKYIGITSCGIEKRIKDHISAANSSTVKETKLYRAIKKYGVNSLTVDYLGSCQNKAEAVILEKAFIETFDTKNNGYNTADGGEGVQGYSFTENDRLKISEAQKRRFSKLSERENTRAKTKSWILENPEKVQEINTRRAAVVTTPEHSAFMSEKMKKVYKDHPEYGKEHSKRLRKMYLEFPEKKLIASRKAGGTPIEAFKDGVSVGVFQTQAECVNVLGVGSGNLGSVLAGRRSHAKGYTFERVRE